MIAKLNLGVKRGVKSRFHLEKLAPTHSSGTVSHTIWILTRFETEFTGFALSDPIVDS